MYNFPPTYTFDYTNTVYLLELQSCNNHFLKLGHTNKSVDSRCAATIQKYNTQNKDQLEVVTKQIIKSDSNDIYYHMALRGVENKYVQSVYTSGTTEMYKPVMPIQAIRKYILSIDDSLSLVETYINTHFDPLLGLSQETRHKKIYSMSCRAYKIDDMSGKSMLIPAITDWLDENSKSFINGTRYVGSCYPANLSFANAKFGSNKTTLASYEMFLALALSKGFC